MPLYIMVKPPAKLRATLRGLVRTCGLDTSYAPEKYHCTFLRLGESRDWPGTQLAWLLHVLDEFEGEPFAVAFDRLDGNLLRGRSGLGAARLFQRRLVRSLVARGVVLPAHRFWLHLSLAYRGDGRTATITPIGWTAEEFLLVRSIHGVGHEELGCWTLRQRQLRLDL